MTRFRSLVLIAVLAVASVGLASCSMTTPPATPAAPPDNRAADESTIRKLDADWVNAVAAKDAHQSASFYAETATVMLPGAPPIAGRDPIEKAFTGMMATPGFALTFAPTKIEVSRAGDFAYELGDYQLTMPDKKGKPQTSKAHYVVVWAKQPDGAWKALVDAPTTSQ
jgi:uncharacterized protein (TIGR02246 family)